MDGAPITEGVSATVLCERCGCFVTLALTRSVATIASTAILVCRSETACARRKAGRLRAERDYMRERNR